MYRNLLLFLITQQSYGQQSVDLHDRKALTTATNLATQNLASYFVASDLCMGCIPANDASDASGMQWYENGIFWESILRVAQLTGDTSHVYTVSAANANASFNMVGSFLGPPEYRAFSGAVLGLWNDDIGWWGMTAITGAELFGNDAHMPGGVTYLKLAENTANDIWESWDSSTCNGGIFWTRDRGSATPRLANYKSTITNAQYLSYASRIYLLNGNQTFLDRGIALWKWLREINLVSSAGETWDGGDAPTCDDSRGTYVESYIYGQLVEGLTYMYLATKNQDYLTSADLLTKKMLSVYSVNNVITDVSCESDCPKNRVSPKGILLRGLASFYPLASDSTKELIRTYVEASFAGMLKTCNSNFACSNYWAPGSPVYSDFHHQLNVVSLFYAAQAIYAPPATAIKFEYASNGQVVLAGSASKTGNGSNVKTNSDALAYSFSNFAGIVLFFYSLFWITS